MKRIIPFMVLCLFLVCCVSVAEEGPKAEIFGPESVRSGDLCVLMTQDSVGSDFKWKVIPEEKYKGRYFVADEGRTLVFASRTPGEIHFVLAVASGDKADMVVHKLVNEADGPDPDPEPGPDPTPPVPSKLAEWVTQNVRQMVPSNVRIATIPKIVEKIEFVCDQIARGEIVHPRAAREEVRLAIDGDLSANQESAWGGFRDALASKLESLAANGNLESMVEIEQGYRAIAAGLEAANE